MVSTISVFRCTLIINPARLFHDFQNVESLYNVEWFAISMQNVFSSFQFKSLWTLEYSCVFIIARKYEQQYTEDLVKVAMVKQYAL